MSVSDICLGNRPSIWRSLKKLSGKVALRIFRVSLEIWIKAACVGFVVGFVPGVVALLFMSLALGVSDSATSPILVVVVRYISGPIAFVASFAYAARFFIVPTVIVLEHVGAAESLRRSLALGRGLYLRNFLLYVTILVPKFLFVIVQIITSATSPLIYRNPGYQLTVLILETIYAPVILITTIILYYDMRARKEGYDLARWPRT